MNRRSFLAGPVLATTLSACVSMRVSITDSPPATIRAVAFDAFPIFDPRSVGVACERMFGARGQELANAWRSRQFEYQWLAGLGGRYRDFWQCTAAALDYACASLQIDADTAQRAALMQEYLRMGVWPEVPGALEKLKARGLELALLSNATPEILETGIRRAGLARHFDHVISTDRNRTFKPDPRAYQLGMEVTGLRREEILFVAFAGWDVAGAKWFGYRTFWNNRQGVPDERLDAAPDARGATLEELARYLGA